jgi:hypothetical protein
MRSSTRYAQLDGEALKQALFGERDKQYFIGVMNAFVEDLDKRAYASIFSFGGINTQSFVSEFSDIDLGLVIAHDDEPEQVIATCLDIGNAVFRATFGLPILKPYVFSKSDLERDINPFFSENVLFDVRATAAWLHGANIVADLPPSTSVGFRADAYFFRSWMRRQLAGAALAMAPRRVAKATLRWTKVTAKYALRLGEIDTTAADWIAPVLSEIDQKRALFQSAGRQDLVSWTIRFAPILEGLTSAILTDVPFKPIAYAETSRIVPEYVELMHSFAKKTQSGTFRESEILAAELAWQDEIFE